MLVRPVNKVTISSRKTTVLEENDKLLTWKHTADLFVKRYKSDSNMNVNKDSHSEVRVELQAVRQPTDTPTLTKKPATLRELQYVVKLKFERSP